MAEFSELFAKYVRADTERRINIRRWIIEKYPECVEDSTDFAKRETEYILSHLDETDRVDKLASDWRIAEIALSERKMDIELQRIEQDQRNIDSYR